jgi:FlaG protein
MSTSDRRVDPTSAAAGTEPVRDFVPGAPSRAFTAEGGRAQGRADQDEERAAATGGHLRPAYAQYVIDPETHEVSVRIRDAATDEVIRQIPAAEVTAANRALREYADALRRAAAQGKAGA